MRQAQAVQKRFKQQELRSSPAAQAAGFFGITAGIVNTNYSYPGLL
jgi:hypothetical protein